MNCLKDNTLEESLVKIAGEEKNVILVKADKKSLYASLAYVFQGPFETQGELAPMASKFQKETVKFIRSNKDLFFTLINRVYRKAFPNDSLDDEIVFEKYCLYLAQSENLIVQVPLRAIATVFKTPIAVLYENGQRNIVEPFFPSTRKPVEIVNRNLLNFCPVFEPELTIATWHVTISQNLGVPVIKSDDIDFFLKKHNVDFACVQNSDAPTSYGEMTTDNYTWWCIKSFSSNDVAFLIRNGSGLKLTNFTSTDGFVAADVHWKSHNYWIYGCNFSSSKDNSHFGKCISKIFSQKRSGVEIVVLGDFNAIIGSSSVNNRNEREFIGTSLYHETSNPFGVTLQDLAVRNNFRIATSFTNEQGLPPVTYTNGNVGYQVSHILMKNQPNKLIKNYLHWETAFNHAIVACTISYPKLTPEDHAEKNNDLRNFTFSTWNCDDWSTAEKRDRIDNILYEKDVDLACIQGKNLLQKESTPLYSRTTHYDWHGSSCTTNKVVLLLRSKCGATLTNYMSLGDSVACALLTIGECSYAVVGCYLPQNVSPSYDDVARNLMIALNTAPPSARLLLLGDFSANLGLADLTTSEELHLANKGLLMGKSNANGTFLKRLALLHDLFICSTKNEIEPISFLELHTSHILLRKGNCFQVEGEVKTHTVYAQKPYIVSFSIPGNAYYLE